ncbi:F-box/LRR-repeat protein At3g48880 [Magnolia sinica]|uniref:F-box/LRR-repeat protein At3g48880 n=1 Tax=Magnolia sinica TaxID=86752 RepID=UPI002659D903|nr:F-box/LRR-repeat protein At3g48880 [Magnolia sinica]XP_058082242.1 F-box/LRR-repeat protein At3g48880 [Magnolia sinica]XP_058082243.1 F-box/LRR-repeat protein At3g48880 [Magnolia sinica]XP_058082244.1 F-box/LRR-repeat protein At3g48880 [Magnolia sinica]
MEESKSLVRRWEDMEIDILVRIFKEFDVIELTSGISRVCSSWRLACSDPLLWKTVDLGILKSNFIQIPTLPYIWVDDRSNKKLTRVLKIAMGLSCGSVTCIIFHVNLYLKDDHLIHIAERCPRLKHLVLPAWDLITKGGICEAIRKWEELESMTMPYICSPPYIMEVIGMNCKNFTQLKVMGCFNVLFASSIAKYLPKLKVLSLRCSTLFMEALILILDCMEHLEVLNVAHCLFIEDLPPPASRRIIRELNEAIIEKAKASRLRTFFYCHKESCVLCQRMVNDNGSMRWFKYEEGSWRNDEVSSLAY